jgi:hypothetical protein
MWPHLACLVLGIAAHWLSLRLWNSRPGARLAHLARLGAIGQHSYEFGKPVGSGVIRLEPTQSDTPPGLWSEETPPDTLRSAPSNDMAASCGRSR